MTFGPPAATPAAASCAKPLQHCVHQVPLEIVADLPAPLVSNNTKT
jgi:hypothetical protein